MLPYALKVVWFALSFSGIFACWIVLTVFARAIGSYWGPMLYCVFATLLQGIFCLGMIYDMNPFDMPPAFCKAQTFIIYYSAHSVTGVCAAFTMATTSAVVWPSSVITTASSTLVWRNQYLLPIVVFPLCAIAVAVPVLLSLHAIQPSDDLHCDASDPIWGRFLGYAGISMILTIPCFFLSATAAHRVFKVHTVRRELFKLTVSHSHSLGGNTGTGPTKNLPSSPLPDVDPKSAEFVDEQVSVMPRKDTPHVDAINDAAANSNESYSPRADILPSSLSSPPSPKRSSDTPQWDESQIRDERVSIVPIEEDTTTLPISSSHEQPRQSLAPAIWRLILFQMAFFIIQFLAALSTIIDVATHRPKPTPFGTQHVALVLVGWGPSIVFGHLPAVRRRLLFWRRPDSNTN
ncbi:hypothetical protein DEU56DRAFT_901254 [Suillus clintonianus]|uniref:uncharacterized protein n=1 Tax=Suillus clintonianus TaxID=1904413 RepID=UPI001B87BF05|nr:uncharacterized protein DEU56DRAFT_901254 [Suillus clintonianus]KAG2138525.1 hypothetical protein DEU56DRAFT_901254 [Suillus clintonianus]